MASVHVPLNDLSTGFDPSVGWERAPIMRGQIGQIRPSSKAACRLTASRKNQRDLWRLRAKKMAKLDPVAVLREVQRWTDQQLSVSISVESISQTLTEGRYAPELLDLRIGKSSVSLEAWLTASMAINYDSPSSLVWNYSANLSRAIRRVYLERFGQLAGMPSILLLTD